MIPTVDLTREYVELKVDLNRTKFLLSLNFIIDGKEHLVCLHQRLKGSRISPVPVNNIVGHRVMLHIPVVD